MLRSSQRVTLKSWNERGWRVYRLWGYGIWHPIEGEQGYVCVYQIRMWYSRSISNFSDAASDGNLVRVNEALDICNISDHFIRFLKILIHHL